MIQDCSCGQHPPAWILEKVRMGHCNRPSGFWEPFLDTSELCTSHTRPTLGSLSLVGAVVQSLYLGWASRESPGAFPCVYTGRRGAAPGSVLDVALTPFSPHKCLQPQCYGSGTLLLARHRSLCWGRARKTIANPFQGHILCQHEVERL